MGDGRAEGSSAVGDGGQAAISLMPDVDDTGSGFLLGWSLSVATGRQLGMSREMGEGARWQEITQLVNSRGPGADKEKQKPPD